MANKGNRSAPGGGGGGGEESKSETSVYYILEVKMRHIKQNNRFGVNNT